MAFRNLTNSGKEYLATRLANELPVKFIKAKIGNGSVPLLTNPANTTDLYNFKKQVTILNAVQEQNSIKLTLQITNDGINEGFYLKEIGIYVDDNGKEVLYWYCNEDNSQYINAQSDIPIVFEIDIMMEVTNINSTIVEWTGKDTWISKTHFDEKVRTFEIPTIAELQSRKNLKVGDIVEVLGYYSAGDGAGHKRIISNEDDGSGVQLNNKLWANIVHNGEVNVSWFGAKGDGVTDDTQVIQKAIDYIPNKKITIKIDNYSLADVLNVKPYKTLTGNKLKVKQLSFYQLSGMENIELRPEKDIEKRPMILLSRENFPTTRCGVVLKNIRVHSEVGDIQDRDFFLMRNINNGSVNGLFGFYAENIYGDVQFNTIYKVQCCKATGKIVKPWITYIDWRDCRWANYKKAIELLTYTEEQGEYGYDNANDKSEISLIDSVRFYNCTFEANKSTESFCRFGNGVRGAALKETYATDYFADKKKFLILDTRGKHINESHFFTLISSIMNERYNEWVTFLGEEYNIYEKNQIELIYGRYTFQKPSIIKTNFVLPQIKHIFIIAKFKPNIKFDNICYIVSQPNVKSLVSFNVPTINISFSRGNSPQFWCSTNIEGLNELSVYKDNLENYYLGVQISKENHFNISNGNIFAYYGQEHYWFKKYDADNLPESDGLIFVENIQFLKPNSSIAQINTIYHLEKMKQENVYDDYITYMDEKTIYDKQQRNLEQDRQLAYQEALKENPELTYEEFMSVQPMTLNLIEEPQPSQALQEFMKKYL